MSIMKYRPISRSSRTCNRSQEHGGNTHERRDNANLEAGGAIARALCGQAAGAGDGARDGASAAGRARRSAANGGRLVGAVVGNSAVGADLCLRGAGA